MHPFLRDTPADIAKEKPGKWNAALTALGSLLRRELGIERTNIIGADAGDASSSLMQRHERFCLVSALIIVPLFMALVYVVVSRTELRYLLYPSLAAIGYQLFINDPRALATSLRDAVFGPFLGALIGVLAITFLAPGPFRLILVTAAAILAIRIFKITLAPAISVALLTLLAGGNSVFYLLSVTASALALTIIFRLWRRFIYLPLFGEMPVEHVRNKNLRREENVS